MKRALLTAALIAVATCLTAQTTSRKGVALGADRDTLLYIIASPFDNWFLELGGGIQTYIGNEQFASARKNQLNYNLHAEVGKWLLPDISVSLRLGFANMDGQTHYGRQPFRGLIAERTPNENGYDPFSAHVGSLLGVVTFDWTNFLMGYEKGKRTRLHVYMPVGMGAAMLFGKQTSDSPSLEAEGYKPGDFRRNIELAFTGGLGLAYEASPKVAINLSAEVMGARQSLDWSPMNEKEQYSIVDWMPSINLGLRFNLFSTVTKYNPYTKQSRKTKVNHEFLTLGSENQMISLKGRIQRLNARIDSVKAVANSEHDRADSEKRRADSLLLQLLNAELQLLDSTQSVVAYSIPPENVFDALLLANQSMDVPFTIIYFDLNKHDIRPDSYKRLQNFAKRAVALGDTAEFFVIGAADAETGNPKINLRLSQLRCKETSNVLVRKLGIDATQLLNVPMGGIAGSGEKNRMAMVILKVPGTESIVEHWSRSVKR
mgnify:CR=1 FL=1